jgi:hypothetical protein
VLAHPIDESSLQAPAWFDEIAHWDFYDDMSPPNLPTQFPHGRLPKGYGMLVVADWAASKSTLPNPDKHHCRTMPRRWGGFGFVRIMLPKRQLYGFSHNHHHFLR